MRPRRIAMTYTPTNERFFWTVERHAATGIWTFFDHGGYERWGGKNWSELVDRFLATAENYAMTCRLS